MTHSSKTNIMNLSRRIGWSHSRRKVINHLGSSHRFGEHARFTHVADLRLDPSIEQWLGRGFRAYQRAHGCAQAKQRLDDMAADKPRCSRHQRGHHNPSDWTVEVTWTQRVVDNGVYRSTWINCQ